MSRTERFSGARTRTLEVARRTGPVVVAKGLSTVLLLAFSVALARVFGERLTGVYFLALTLITVTGAIGRIGLDNAIVRFVAASASSHAWDRVAGVVRLATRYASAGLVVAGIILFAASSWLSGTVFDDAALLSVLRIMTAAMVPAGLLALFGQALRALQKPTVAEVVTTTAVLATMFGFVLAARDRLDIEGVSWAFLVANAAWLAVAVRLWVRSTPRVAAASRRFDASLLLRTSLPLLTATSMSLVIAWTDTIMLGVLRDSSDVGVYASAIRVATISVGILVALNTVVAPRFAAIFEDGDGREFDMLTKVSARISFLISLPLVAASVLFADEIMGVFGPGFSRGSRALVILSLGWLVSAALGSVETILMMTGEQKALQYTLLGAGFLNAALNLALIPAWGLNGAATATALTVVYRNVLAAVIVYRRRGVLSLAGFGRSRRLERAQYRL